MQINVAMRKNNGQFEGALIVDGKFNRSASNTSAMALFTGLVGGLLGQTLDDGSELGFQLTVLPRSEVERQERHAKMQQETAIANAEGELLEKRNAAILREHEASNWKNV